MAKKRPSIPKAISEQVLKEFRHLCAICGRHQPQLHHLDENPANNDVLNLLPLCPNCHLQDTHDPTSAPDPRKLRLFRRHKDPLILDPRFHPIFVRMMYLWDDQLRADRPKHFNYRVNELLDFIGALKMGSFYKKRILNLLQYPDSHFRLSKFGPAGANALELVDTPTSGAAWENSKTQVEILIIELLRYQEWTVGLPGNNATG